MILVSGLDLRLKKIYLEYLLFSLTTLQNSSQIIFTWPTTQYTHFSPPPPHVVDNIYKKIYSWFSGAKE